MSEWRTIESAPEDKILIMFAVTDVGDDGEVRNWKMATGYWSQGYADWKSHTGWHWDGRPIKIYDVQPTHWMPLPEPPTGA